MHFHLDNSGTPVISETHQTILRFFSLDFLGKYFKLDCTCVWAAVLKQSSACIPHAQIKHLLSGFLSSMLQLQMWVTHKLQKILSCVYLWGASISTGAEPLKRSLDVFAQHPRGPLPRAISMACSSTGTEVLFTSSELTTAPGLAWEGCTYTRTYFLTLSILH